MPDLDTKQDAASFLRAGARGSREFAASYQVRIESLMEQVTEARRKRDVALAEAAAWDEAADRLEGLSNA